MTTTPQEQSLIRQKLDAFEHLQAEFETCFRFMQDVHGQRRFSSFPIANTVRYLHARWVCECKDRLLSIYKNIERYEGCYCLELLQRLQRILVKVEIVLPVIQIILEHQSDLRIEISAALRHGLQIVAGGE